MIKRGTSLLQRTPCSTRETFGSICPVDPSEVLQAKKVFRVHREL
jgi:hypothetical protein